MPLKAAWLYSPSLRRVPLGQQDQEDHENPANMRRPLRKKYFMLIICNRKSTFPLIDQLELVCFSVMPDFFFFFPPRAHLLRNSAHYFYCLWSLMPWHKIYKEHNIFQNSFIGHYKPGPHGLQLIKCMLL